MKKSIIVVGISTAAAQGVIYAIIHNVDLLVSVVVACIFLVQGLGVYVLTDRESFEKGLEASKETNKVEALVNRQVTAALGLVKQETARAKKANDQAPGQSPTTEERKTQSFHDLEITGLDD